MSMQMWLKSWYRCFCYYRQSQYYYSPLIALVDVINLYTSLWPLGDPDLQNQAPNEILWEPQFSQCY